MGQGASQASRHKAELEQDGFEHKSVAAPPAKGSCARKTRPAEAEKSTWFHGDCEPVNAVGDFCKYNVPEMESSFSDSEDHPPPDPLGSRKRARKNASGRVSKTFQTLPTREMAARSSPPKIQTQAPTKNNNKEVRRKRFKSERTELQEIRCLNHLMESAERSNMELAHGWCPVFHSPNISLLADKPLTFYRKPIAQSTDAARSAQSYSRGVHLFEVTWPSTQRGTHPLVGVSLSTTPLQGSGYIALLGSDKSAWGWDLRRNVLVHDGVNEDKYPEAVSEDFACPDIFSLILDMDRGTLSFEAEGKFLGVAFDGFTGHSLHPAVSAVWGSCEVKLRYVGGSTGRLMSLQQICRRTVRKALTSDRLSDEHIDQLPLPRMMRNYVSCKIA